MGEGIGQLDNALTVYPHQMIKVDDTSFLNSTSLHYVNNAGDKVGATVAENGSIAISQSLDFDAIDVLRHIVDIKTIDTFDLIDAQGE
jgi:hypothetical protein